MSVRMAEGVSAQVPADDFQALEEKVYRTIELYKSGRDARAAAERDTQRLDRARLSIRRHRTPAPARNPGPQKSFLN